ncbi:protein PHOSPHATE STARVATION RESPONSE 1-like [Silene latifolia]|uniref:protein PHOSPHATE STARVATION RESPONSE 1-like n=1 Tax=Silene latifolia TaxID=37657 RepID=UPI003D7856DB
MDQPSDNNEPLSAHNNPGFTAHIQPAAHTNPGSIQPRRHRTLFQWTPELRNKFVEAVNSLGGAEQASATDILELMGNVNNLTKRVVASRLLNYKKRAEGQRRTSNLQENSTYTADPLEESRRAYSLGNTHTLNQEWLISYREDYIRDILASKA